MKSERVNWRGGGKLTGAELKGEAGLAVDHRPRAQLATSLASLPLHASWKNASIPSPPLPSAKCDLPLLLPLDQYNDLAADPVNANRPEQPAYEQVLRRLQHW